MTATRSHTLTESSAEFLRLTLGHPYIYIMTTSIITVTITSVHNQRSFKFQWNIACNIYCFLFWVLSFVSRTTSGLGFANNQRDSSRIPIQGNFAKSLAPFGTLVRSGRERVFVSSTILYTGGKYCKFYDPLQMDLYANRVGIHCLGICARNDPSLGTSVHVQV